jgi:hypothetical protein
MFHYKDGWFFERNPDGSVRVLKMSDATGQAVKVSEANIDPDAWASIVSFVSAEKSASVAWSAVKEFHMEGILRAPLAEAPQSERQIDQLANFILNEVPGEPSENEGAVDTAIRLIRRRGALPNRAGLTSRVMEALGSASRCWDPKPTGVFDAQAAVLVGDELVESIIGPMVPGTPETPIAPELVPDSVFVAPEALGSPPSGAELEQPGEAPPEQPEEPPYERGSEPPSKAV